MGSTFSGIELGKRSIMANTDAITTAGHNISNANTEGYSRQRVQIKEFDPLYKPDLERAERPGLIGQGVDVQSINRWSCTKAKSGNRPKFNSAVRLLMHGATVETLFGVEYNKIHGLGGKIKITNEDISNAMLVAAELLRNQKNENSPASENNESVDDVNDSIENG